MKFKKETFVFLTALLLIIVIAYINIVLTNKDNNLEQAFDEDELKAMQDAFVSDYNDLSYKSDIEIKENDDVANLNDKSNETEINEGKINEDESNEDEINEDDIEQVISTENIDIAFENFKISKAQNNSDIVDKLEKNISNELLSADTIKKFEEMLVVKNNEIQMESNIEIMLKSKGYNNVSCVISNDSAKVITNTDLDKSDVATILDVVMNETKFKATGIKIVKFDNN